MSFMTGLRASTSRCLLNDLPRVSVPARRWASDSVLATKATTLQDVEKDIQRIKDKQEAAIKKQEQQMKKVESTRGGRAVHTLDQQAVVYVPIEAHVDKLSHLGAVFKPSLYFGLIDSKRFPGLKFPGFKRESFSQLWNYLLQERRPRSVDTLKNLNETGIQTPLDEYQAIPLARRIRNTFVTNAKDRFLPTAREALDIYTSYYHAQSTDYETIDAKSIKDMRATARAVAASGKVVEWGYTTAPALPEIAYNRAISVDEKQGIKLYQMGCIFDTEQFIVMREIGPDGKSQRVTRRRRVQENIVLQKVWPDKKNQGWMIAGRQRDTPPLFTLKGKEAEEMKKYLADYQSALARLSGM